MLKNFFDDLFVLDKADYLYPPLALGTVQVVHFINLLNEPGSVVPVHLCIPFGLQDARNPDDIASQVFHDILMMVKIFIDNNQF